MKTSAKKLKILETSRTPRRTKFLSVSRTKVLEHSQGLGIPEAIENRKLKILEVTTYTAGGCGVAARVLQETELLAQRGHEVTIFSTNHVKGRPKETAPTEEQRGSVLIRRFPAKKLGGESFSSWYFEKEALALKPDVIIAHAYRQMHTTRALYVAKKLNIPVLLVTHAPFSTGNEQRSLASSLAINLYDRFVAPRTLPRFAKVIAITHWELPYLLALGVPKEKIAYIPNGIPPLFFTQKAAREQKDKIFYFGRLAPVKDLETAIRALSLMKNPNTVLELAGPAEPRYLVKLKSLVASLHLESRVSFISAIYDLKQKIRKFDSAHLFVLPSLREGMPQSLIETMSRKKLVIASDNLGARDIIKNKKNGFLFPIGNAQALADTLDKALALPATQARKIRRTARSSVEQFAWPIVIKELETLLEEVKKEKRVR